MSAKKVKIAILGAGPIGLEAGLYARALGYEPKVYERSTSGANILRWGFIRLFSPWKLNVSPLGLQALGRAGKALPKPNAFPLGKEYVDSYLRPIAASLSGAVETGTEVLAISRYGILKADGVGDKKRGRSPFRLLVRRNNSEAEDAADVILDATGVYSNPSFLGDGGIPALGELSARNTIYYHLPEVRGAARSEFSGKTTLVVGAGFSAATLLEELILLHKEEPKTRILWARRSAGPNPLPLYPSDPLPERARLARACNRIAAEPPDSITVFSGVVVKAVSRVEKRFRVELRSSAGGDASPLTVDRVVALIGYRPDLSLYRELQVHQCYASEGPMSLAALLAKGGEAGGNCLAQASFGPDSLRSPEPNFFILGNKSYGRRSDFLLRAGREQVRDAFKIIEQSPELDLYAQDAAVGAGNEG